MTELEMPGRGILQLPRPGIPGDEGPGPQAVARYNSLQYDQKREKEAILRQLLGSMGDHVSIAQPFLCDYGRNIHIGNNVSVNMNCTFVDCNAITIGDQVLIASNVQLYTSTHPVELAQRLTPGWKPDPTAYFCRTYALPIRIGNGCWLGGRGDRPAGGANWGWRGDRRGQRGDQGYPGKRAGGGEPCRVLRPINQGGCEKP